MTIESKAKPSESPPVESHALSGLSSEVKSMILSRQRWKERTRQAEKERDAALAELTALKSKPADKTAAQLKAELIEIRHRLAFDKLATSSEFKAKYKVNAQADALDDLWKLTGYTPETELVDPDQMEKMLAEQIQKRPRFFTPTDEKTEKSESISPEKPPEPGPGSSRGSLVQDSGKFQVRRGRVGGPKDPEWMQVHQAEYHKAIQEGNVEWVD